MSKQSALVTALNEAGQEDLDAVVQRREEVERELKTLETVERVLRIKLSKILPVTPSGDGTKKKHATPKETEGDRRAMAILLIREGRLTKAIIAQKMGKPDHRIAYLASHEWFVNTGSGVEVSPLGRQVNG